MYFLTQNALSPTEHAILRTNHIASVFIQIIPLRQINYLMLLHIHVWYHALLDFSRIFQPANATRVIRIVKHVLGKQIIV